MTDLTTPQTVAAFLTPTAVFLLFLVLHAVIPARHVDGYTHPSASGIPNRYRLNGLAVFVAALVIWWLELTFAPLGWLWVAKWHVIAGGVVLSVVLTAWIVLRAPADERGALTQWMEGRSRTAQFRGDIDGKMFLYIFGGGLLGLNAVSSAAYHFGEYGDAANLGLFLHSAMWVWFVVDYFVFERVQLYTFDIIEERLGFKLIVGCIVVHPCVYPIALWATAHLPAPDIDPSWNPLWLGGATAVFLAGWVITRGANQQKYVFKRFPERAFLGFIRPATLTDGDRTILCSGFWGPARHMNYTGEVLEALGMALALGHFTNIWTWAYFVCLTLFFVVRARIDEGRCAGKYGELWTQYRGKARYRLLPGGLLSGVRLATLSEISYIHARHHPCR